MKNVKFSRNGVEFEPTKQELKIVLDDFAKQVGERDKRIADLEAKLAEKDTQIQSQKKNLEFFYDVFNNSGRYQTFSDINQAKTDFAIEKLEKVKNEIYGSEVKFEEIEKLPIALNNYEMGYDKGRFKATNIIDNQIKDLKRESK